MLDNGLLFERENNLANFTSAMKAEEMMPLVAHCFLASSTFFWKELGLEKWIEIL
jgi:hypothetical protein